MPPKKKNPQDTTFRNINALKWQIASLKSENKKLWAAVKALQKKK